MSTSEQNKQRSIKSIKATKTHGNDKNSNRDTDGDSDYERHHKKKKKGTKFCTNIDAEPRKKRNKHFKRSQTVGTDLDSDKNDNFQKFYRRNKPNKSRRNNRNQSSKDSDSDSLLSNSDSNSDDIPIKIKIKSSKQKTRSKTPVPRLLNETKARKSKKKTQKSKAKTPKAKKTKSRTTSETKNLKFEVGNDADLSAFALDSKKRDAIKANKNATFGGFKLKINYRYRLDDNRICLCRFIGIPLFAQSGTEYVGMGVEYNGSGEHNGSVQNKSYFRCRDGKGIFVRPYRIIEDLGINTIKLTKEQIEGSAEIKQLIKDIKNGTATRKNVVEQKVRKKKNKKDKKRGLKQRSKTVTNLDEKGKWKPPSWINEIDQDHGYDFLASKPFYSKEHLQKHKYKNKPVSVTAFNRKNNY